MNQPANPYLRFAVDRIIDAASQTDRTQSIEVVLRELTERYQAIGSLIHEETDDEV